MAEFDYVIDDIDRLICEPQEEYSPRPIAFEDPSDIERARTEVVKLCNALWRAFLWGPPPQAISKTICILRDKSYITRHQANMMLTLCNLRNLFVYENLHIGQNETMVAKGAWSIIYEWWDQALPKQP